ncbi:Epsin-3, clathrin recruitment and traffic between the Golgi and endosome [Agyrium rufum]|nr:Epsin-3, clathrin recruitment and traffic between the Golgi and endosome [Agyrium rufum]
MDFSSLKDQVSNLSLYDIKAGVRKVQNAVMNYTEMEAKVREATNNEPWGASSTLMQEIANGTYSYHLLNEIMPMIYKRFTEKAQEEWRQIYKALQLLEFLIKNGSERVVDDARQHIALLKMLRQFQFIDMNGKDQGINVRNRSKELAELLGDVERIRAERKKARSNRTKFGGVEGGGGSGTSMSSGSRYGGFGSEDATFGGSGRAVYGDGGGFGGNTDSSFQDSSSRRDKFEEYDEYDEGATTSPRRNRETASSSTPRREPKKKQEEVKPPEVDLFSFGDDDAPPAIPPKPSVSNGKQAVVAASNDDDDFDDFISAPPAPAQPPTIASLTSSTQFASPKPVSGNQGTNISGLVSLASPPRSTVTSPPLGGFSSPLGLPITPSNYNQPKPSAQQPMMQPSKPAGFQAPQPNYFTSIPAPSAPSNAGSSAFSPLSTTNSNQKPSLTSTPSFGNPASKSASKGGDAFGNLWSSASQGAGIKKTNSMGTGSGQNLASMAKERSQAGIWGAASSSSSFGGGVAPAQQQQGQQQSGQRVGGDLDDLLG